MKNIGSISFFLVVGVWLLGNSLPSWSSTDSEPMAIQELAKDEDLRELVNQAPKRIIIDFYADWCSPCRRQSEILTEVANEHFEGELRIIKVNVDKHPALAAKFRVDSIPTLFVVENRKVLQRHQGVACSSKILEWLGE